MHADPVDKSRILNRQYESAFPTEKENADIPVLQGNAENQPRRSIEASQEESGPDMTPARILRDLSDVIAPIFMTIFQRPLSLGKYQTGNRPI